MIGIVKGGTVRKRTGKTREKASTGEVRRLLSLGSFDVDIHRYIMSMASKDRTAGQMYSEAISSLKSDFEAGVPIAVQAPPDDGKFVKVWIDGAAWEALNYLTYKMDRYNRQIVYTALLRWLPGATDRKSP